MLPNSIKEKKSWSSILFAVEITIFICRQGKNYKLVQNDLVSHHLLYRHVVKQDSFVAFGILL